MVECDICGAQVERRKLGPHISAHVRQAKAKYIYIKNKKHPYEWKTCPTCGVSKLMDRRVTFCSLRCSRLESFNPGWKGDEAKPTTARIRSHRRFANDICSQCGATDHIQRHHKNHDLYDNSPENIAVLCAACHGREHRRLPRAACAVCGQQCPLPKSIYCSRACCGLAWRGRRRGGRAA
jgi:hypothetical protein